MGRAGGGGAGAHDGSHAAQLRRRLVAPDQGAPRPHHGACGHAQREQGASSCSTLCCRRQCPRPYRDCGKVFLSRRRRTLYPCGPQLCDDPRVACSRIQVLNHASVRALRVGSGAEL